MPRKTRTKSARKKAARRTETTDAMIERVTRDLGEGHVGLDATEPACGSAAPIEPPDKPKRRRRLDQKAKARRRRNPDQS